MEQLNRRNVLKFGLGAAAATVAMTGLGVKQILAEPTQSEYFDEIYQGRRIRYVNEGAAGHGHTKAVASEDDGIVNGVYVDDQPLHSMRNGDGKYSSVINHYQAFDTVRDLARAAVDSLQGAQLVAI